MKTISTRFLKGALAMLLAVVMLFGTTITGFAAVVDNADTRASVDVAQTSAISKGRIYFQNNWKFTEVKIYYWGASSNNPSWPGVNMNKCNNTVDGHDMYYYDVPACTGIIFTGKDNGNFKQSVDITSSPTSGHAYCYSGWSGNNTTVKTFKYIYKATFKKHDDTTHTTLDVEFNKKPKAPEAPVRAGYTFEGWSSDDGKTKYAANVTLPAITADITYKAYYTQSTVDVKIGTATNGNATVNGSSSATVNPGDSVTLKATPNPGYEFAGWSYDSSAGSFTSGSASTADAVFQTNKTVTFTPTFARTGYKATFLNYDSTELKSGYVNINNTPVAPTVDELNLPTGFEFVGWDPEVSAITDSDVTYTAQVNVPVTVTAICTDDGTTFNAGGGYITYQDEVNTPIESPVKTLYNTDFQMKAWANEGYRFLGWSVNGSDEIASVDQDITTIKITELRSYEAKFIKTYDISLTAVDGVASYTYTINGVESPVVDNKITVDVGSTVSIKAIPDNSHRVTGWGNDEGDTITIENVSDNTTLTATTTPLYNVTAEAYTNKKADTTGGTATVSVAKAAELEKVTFKATANDNYEFIGWYYDSAFTSPVENGKTATITHTMGTEAVTLYALFAKEFYYSGYKATAINHDAKFTYNVATGSYKYTLPSLSGAYGDTTDNFGIMNADATLVDNTVAAAKNTTSVVLYYNASDKWRTFVIQTSASTEYDNQNLNVTLTPNSSGNFDLEITALEKNQKTVTFVNRDNGQVLFTKNVTVGSSSSFEITGLPEDKYIVNPTAVTDAGDNVEVAIIGRNCTIKNMPDDNVTITVSLGQLYSVKFDDATGLTVSGETYYKPGETVSITVSANGKGVLKSVTASGGHTQTFAAGADGKCLVTFAMPAENVTLTAQVDVSYEVVVTPKTRNIFVDNVADNAGGSVSATGIGNNNLTTAKEVTLTATPTSGYTFVGYFANEACTELIEANRLYSFRPSEDKQIYALFVNNVYMPGGIGTDWQFNRMKYDYEKQAYYHAVNSKDFQFKITPASNWNDESKWQSTTLTDTTTVNLDRENNSDSKSNGKITSVTGTYNSIVLYFAKNGSAYKLYGETSNEVVEERESFKVYLSSGNVSLNGSYTPSYFESVSIITNYSEDIDEVGSGDASHNSENRVNENYLIYNVYEQMDIDIQTTISGSSASTYEILNYVVYGIESKDYLEIIVPSEDKANIFTASFHVTEDCYIIPVFTRTEQYYTDNEGAIEFEVYFDSQDILDTNWGPFVSAYVYGTDAAGNEVKLEGGWPGQLMVPTADGKSYYLPVSIPKGVTPAAIVFCNFMEFSVPYNHKSEFGLGDMKQTYDYREGITLKEQGNNSVYFRAEPGDSIQHTTPAANQGITLSNFKFEYLADFNNTHLMNLNGATINEKLPTVAEGTVPPADYYIVAKGYVNIEAEKYEFDKKYHGIRSVEWYVYNSNGAYITHHLSDTFYHNEEYSATGTDTTSELIELIMKKENKTASYYDDKKVAISYEQINGNRFDGQWYGGNSLLSTATTYVGLADTNGNFTFADMAETNDEKYGAGYVLGENGAPTNEVTISSDIGYITLQAEPKAGHVFVGWYTFDKNGNAKRISANAYQDDVSLNFSESYYAVFRPVGENELVVNHNIYVNNDSASGVPSYGGRAKLYVEIKDSQGNIAKGPYSNGGSTASMHVTEGETYTITIKTDPTGQDKFYAWYMATTDFEGKLAYEEVLMETDDVINKIGKSEEVVASFTYTYNPRYKNNIIDLYSNLEKVSTKCTFIYQYKDRFNLPKQYTVTAELNEEELEGYFGNGFNPYYPTYITKYELFNASGKLVDTVYGEDAFNAYDKSLYQDSKSYNAVSMYAPSADVTQAYDKDIVWIITKQYMTTLTESRVVLEADVTPSTYDIEYKLPGQPVQTKTDIFYNTLLHDQIVAPSEYNGNKFSYWREYKYLDDGSKEYLDIVGYREAYNYRITEDKNIEAFYGMSDGLDPWAPTIDSVTYTRELSDDSDYVYTDYLLAFNSRDGEIVDKLKEANPGSIEYGLINIRNASYVYSEEQYNADMEKIKDNKLSALTIQYPSDELSADYLKDYVVKIAKLDGNKSFKNSDKTVTYNAYSYNLTDSETTDFNRMDYILRYNLNNASQKGYAFTCYAYIIIDDNVYVSSPVNTAIAPSAYAPVN